MASSSSTQEQIFKVKYKSITREVLRAQLQQAPDSILSRMLLDSEVDKVSIPSEGSAPGPAIWREGSEQLFEASVASS